MNAAALIACEVAFWAILLAGLTARYVWSRKRIGAKLLFGVPLVDLLLLTVTVIDLATGTRADWTHGLAAVYLGFGVVFGPGLIRAADRHFARRFHNASQTAAVLAPAEDRLTTEWHRWGRCLLASALACGLIAALVLIGGPTDTRALWAGGGWFAQLGVLCVLWLLLGPVWSSASRHIFRHRETPA